MIQNKHWEIKKRNETTSLKGEIKWGNVKYSVKKKEERNKIPDRTYRK